MILTLMVLNQKGEKLEGETMKKKRQVRKRERATQKTREKEKKSKTRK